MSSKEQSLASATDEEVAAAPKPAALSESKSNTSLNMQSLRDRLHLRAGVRTRTLKKTAHKRRKSIAFGRLVRAGRSTLDSKKDKKSSGTFDERKRGRRGSLAFLPDPVSRSQSTSRLEHNVHKANTLDMSLHAAAMAAASAAAEAAEAAAEEKKETASRIAGTSVRYYRNKLPEDGGIDIRHINEEKGKGMFALRDVPRDGIVFLENKFLGMQLQASLPTAMCCAHCMKFVGPLEEHVKRLALLSDKPIDKPVPTLPFKDAESKSLETKPLACKSLCGAIYCSLKCRVENHMQHHQLLCPEDKVYGKFLKEFYEHADSTNENFRMVAQVIAMVIRRIKTKEMSFEQALKPFSYITKRTWWELVQPPDDMLLDEATAFTETLKQMSQESARLLKLALCSKPEYEPLFELEFYGHLIGMFEINNWGTTSKNPLISYWRTLQSLKPDQLSKAKKELGPYYRIIKAHHKHNAEGTGLYTLGATINHSCMPNVALTKRAGDRDDAAAVVAIRPISAGEEICISYIDEKMKLRERQEALSEFGFECRCMKCLRDILNQPPDIVIYTSNVSGKRSVPRETRSIENLLAANKFEFRTVDISLEENITQKNFMQRKSGSREFPQVFVNGNHRGTWQQFEEANEQEVLLRFIKFGDLKKQSFGSPKNKNKSPQGKHKKPGHARVGSASDI